MRPRSPAKTSEQVTHPGDRATRVLAQEEGVPRGEQWAWHPCDEDGVIDVADHAVFFQRVDHSHPRHHGVASIDGDDRVVPSG